MLHFDELGEGVRPVFLLHGFLGSGRNLRGFARRWIRADPDLRLVLPDLTGHGASPDLPTGADLDTLARDVLALAGHLGLSAPVDLVGHSLGGRVGLAALGQDPGAVGSLVLLDIRPGPIVSDEGAPVMKCLRAAPATFATRAEARAFLTRGGVPGPIADWLVTNLVHEAGGYRWRIDREALAAFGKRANAADLWPAVEAAPSRIRCIKGGASRYVRKADVARFRAAGVRVDVLEGAGHFVHVDAPGPLVALLTAG